MTLECFLQDAGWDGATKAPLTGDASSRRYARIVRPDGARAVLMQDPDLENFARFLQVAAHLEGLGLSSPTLFETAQIDGVGCAILEDFGDQSLAKLLSEGPRIALQAYRTAEELLRQMEQAPIPTWIARPDRAGQASMVSLTFDQLPGPSEEFVTALESALDAHAGGAPTLSLRDFHGDNLMWLPERVGSARVGLLDFQDAVALPRGYDLASLIDDPRRVVPDVWRKDLIATFAESTGMGVDAATARIDTLSVMRNVRILGIFRRLATTLGKPHYAAFLPRVWAVIDRAAANPALGGLALPLADLRRSTQMWLL